ncbi:hypothetical protein C8J55DRAFT_554928 [Lentinula edodes]|uniref:Uncharacterized protein n=1 Tax=Lentinula lateritia TaxID=40482 RepID=A0A9W9AYC0_9AGAR|nr:hypothetical protein C8J55DRAFT_554928 [Lentinula edodes]
MNDSELHEYYLQHHSSNSYLGHCDNALPAPASYFYNDSRHLYSHPIAPGREKPQPFVLHIVGRVSAQGNFMSLKKSISSLLNPNAATEKIQIKSLRHSALLGRARAGPFPQDWPHAMSKLKELMKILTKSETEPTRNLWVNEGGNVNDVHIKFGSPCFKTRTHGEPPDGRLADLIPPHQRSNSRWTQAVPYITISDFNIIDHTGTSITEAMLLDVLNGATVDIAFVLCGWKFNHEKCWSFALDVKQVVLLRPKQIDSDTSYQLYKPVTPPRRSGLYHPPTPITPSNNRYLSNNVSVAPGAVLPLGLGLGGPSTNHSGTFDASLTGNGRFNLQHDNAMFNSVSAPSDPPAFNALGTRGMSGDHSSPAAISLNPPFLPYPHNVLATANNLPPVNTNNTMMEQSVADTTTHVHRLTPYGQGPFPNNNFLVNNRDNFFDNGIGGQGQLHLSSTDHGHRQQLNSQHFDFENSLSSAINLARLQHMSQSHTDTRSNRAEYNPSSNLHELRSPFHLKAKSFDSADDQHFMAQELEYMNDMSPPSPIATNQKSIVMPQFNWEDVDANSSLLQSSNNNVVKLADNGTLSFIQVTTRANNVQEPSGNGGERFDGGGNTRAGPINMIGDTIFGQNKEPSPLNGAPYKGTGTGIMEGALMQRLKPYPSNTTFYSASGMTTSEGEPAEGRGKKRSAPDDGSIGPEPATKVAKVDKTQRGGPGSGVN